MGNLINAFMLGSPPPPSDSFNRADTTGPLGATDVGSLPWVETGGEARSFGIDSNRAYVSSFSSSNYVSLAATLTLLSPDNYTITTRLQGTAPNQSLPGVFARGGFTIRYSSPSNLWVYRNGVFVASTSAHTLGNSFGIKVSGTTIDFLNNGVSFYQRTSDTFNQTDATVGLIVDARNSNPPTGVRWDYFNITTP